MVRLTALERLGLRSAAHCIGGALLMRNLDVEWRHLEPPAALLRGTGMV